jgi:hypothetical protein
MTNPPAPIPLPDVATIQLHPDAERLADIIVASHRQDIIQLAKTLAVQDSANQVQSGHIEAARMLFRKTSPRNKLTEIVLALGGAFFGAFIQGFIEALANNRTTLIPVYVALGFLGLGMVFWNLLRR